MDLGRLALSKKSFDQGHYAQTSFKKEDTPRNKLILSDDEMLYEPY